MALSDARCYCLSYSDKTCPVTLTSVSGFTFFTVTSCNG
jgi:hypothetical protein